MEKKDAMAKATKPTAIKKGRLKTCLLKRKFLSLYAELHGNISAICARIRINRATFYDWKDKDKTFSDRVDAAMEALIDHVEDQLHAAIDKKDIASIIFFLKCRAKNRGYVERQEFTGPNGGPIESRLSLVDYRKSKKEIGVD